MTHYPAASCLAPASRHECSPASLVRANAEGSAFLWLLQVPIFLFCAKGGLPCALLCVAQGAPAFRSACRLGGRSFSSDILGPEYQGALAPEKLGATGSAIHL